MELSRFFILSALFLVAFMLWNAWENDYGKTIPLTPAGTTITSSLPPSTAQVVGSPGAATSTPPVTPPTTPVATAQATTVASASVSHNLIHVQTDLLSVAIDPVGGGIVQVNLLKYPQKVDTTPSIPYQLFNTDPATYYVAQSGLLSKQGPDKDQTQATYSVSKNNYSLAPNQNQLTVDLKWQNPQGLIVHKQFIFNRDDYQVHVNYQIVNRMSVPWVGQFYAQIQRKKVAPASRLLFGINPYMGAAISSPDKPYQKVSFDKLAAENLDMQIQGGWLAMQEHYFLSAWVPNPNQTFNYYSQVSDGNIYTIGLLGPSVKVDPGSQLTANAKLYVGPEITDRLKAVAPHLDLTMDYSVLWFISMPLLWLMKHIYNIVGNWGWSIVLLTVLIKLVFFPLSAMSYRSMAAMRLLQPRLQSIKERHAGDKQKMTQATMELYRAEKINPLGGCLPILVQIPVFIALYFVLMESVELRQSPFIFWIHDLSLKDPYFVLPILMGLTMFIQQRLNPPPADPTQAKIMMFLPVFFTFFFLSFPAGLVLYWLVNNTLSILQQWHITRRIETAGLNKKSSTAISTNKKKRQF